jgi:hypothetical protein
LTKTKVVLSSAAFDAGKRDEEKTAITAIYTHIHNKHIHIYYATIKKAQNATQKREYYAYILPLQLSICAYVSIFYINNCS